MKVEALLEQAYFLTTGCLVYLLGSEKHSVSKRRWLAEMSLWTPWLHLGELTAVTDSEALRLPVVLRSLLCVLGP